MKTIIEYLPDDWRILLQDITNSIGFSQTIDLVTQAYETQKVYPPKEQLFAAFQHCKVVDLKVVILGQDPYHQYGQANGLSFSVNPGIAIPPSLRNIYTELYNDLGILPKNHGDLSTWAKQGVLLLNTYLSVVDSKPMAHSKYGWEAFTDFVIHQTNLHCKNVVYILWGNFAQKKSILIDETKHLIIKSAHPSPLSASRGFLGSKPFSTTNKYLLEHQKEPIDWSL